MSPGDAHLDSYLSSSSMPSVCPGAALHNLSEVQHLPPQRETTCSCLASLRNVKEKKLHSVYQTAWSDEKCPHWPVVLSRWVTTPLGIGGTVSQGSHIRYPAYQIFTLQSITVAKLQLGSSNKNNFMVEVTTTWGRTAAASGRLRTIALGQMGLPVSIFMVAV